MVSFLDQDICLIALANNNLLLANTSLNCNHGPIYLINDNNKKAAFVDICFLDNKNFLLTLDERGELKLWSIADERRRSLVRRAGSKQRVNPLNFTQSTKSETKSCVQSLHEHTMCKRGKIVAMHLQKLRELYKGEEKYQLHMVFDNGDVCIFEWLNKEKRFKFYNVPILQTNEKGIRFITYLFEKFYMLLNNAGDISFWNLRDSSKTPASFDWPTNNSTLIYYNLYQSRLPKTNELQTYCLVVFSNKIIRLKIKQQTYNILSGEPEVLYESPSKHSEITCAKLSDDNCYVVLGTKKGLIVYDLAIKSEILRSNVSEAIACVDMFTLDDVDYKYVIICGPKRKNILNLFALCDNKRDSLMWSHNLQAIGNDPSNDPQLEPDVWLLGEKLYDISNNGTSLLLAVDSKHRVSFESNIKY